MIFFIEGIAYLQLAIGVHQFVAKAIVYFFMNNKPPGGGTTLSGRAYSSESGPYKRHLQVGIL
jgi:hypothetical protein